MVLPNLGSTLDELIEASSVPNEHGESALGGSIPKPLWKLGSIMMTYSQGIDFLRKEGIPVEKVGKVKQDDLDKSWSKIIEEEKFGS